MTTTVDDSNRRPSWKEIKKVALAACKAALECKLFTAALLFVGVAVLFAVLALLNVGGGNAQQFYSGIAAACFGAIFFCFIKEYPKVEDGWFHLVIGAFFLVVGVVIAADVCAIRHQENVVQIIYSDTGARDDAYVVQSGEKDWHSPYRYATSAQNAFPLSGTAVSITLRDGVNAKLLLEYQGSISAEALLEAWKQEETLLTGDTLVQWFTLAVRSEAVRFTEETIAAGLSQFQAAVVARLAAEHPELQTDSLTLSLSRA